MQLLTGLPLAQRGLSVNYGKIASPMGEQNQMPVGTCILTPVIPRQVLLCNVQSEQYLTTMAAKIMRILYNEWKCAHDTVNLLLYKKRKA